MEGQRHAIFREKALKHYTQGRKKDVLPNFSSLSAGVFVWILLASMLATGLVAWYGQVPVFRSGSGIILGSNGVNVANHSANALAFFMPSDMAQVHAGDTAQVQLGAVTGTLNGTIVQVLPGTSDLATALNHYGLSMGNTQAQSQQVGVALVNLGADFSTAKYAGSPFALQVNVGSQSLFSALTGIGVS
jgi:hypothetical protein